MMHGTTNIKSLPMLLLTEILNVLVKIGFVKFESTENSFVIIINVYIICNLKRSR